MTLKHFKKSHIKEVLGDTEKELYNQLIPDNSAENIVTNRPVFLLTMILACTQYETPSKFGIS